MYSTCLFCQAALGKNEVVEHFPVGRRLAFDAHKGRLWVVCRKCLRWNLTPLEERWEAIEECERAFSTARMRVSTDNVGLARLKEGLELVRIGVPQRPEFAAWRYGDQFARRRRRHVVVAGTFGALAVGNLANTLFGASLGIAAAGTTVSGLYSVMMFVNLYQAARVRSRIAVPGEQRPIVVRKAGMDRIRIVSSGSGWAIRMPADAGVIGGAAKREITIDGDPALRGAATILSVMNESGAEERKLRRALDVVSATPDASQLFIDAARQKWPVDSRRNRRVPRGSLEGAGETRLTAIPDDIRLALEMATNEDIERRALEGELAMLEAAWRQAEEIAAIADNLDLEKPGDISARSEA
jgi:hypothetical protein